MRSPAGDQAGPESADVPDGSVSRRNCCPSACMTQMERFPSTVLSKAIRLPSGDQAGRASKASGRLVRVWGDEPSTLTTYTEAGTMRPLALGSPDAAGAGVLSAGGVV